MPTCVPGPYLIGKSVTVLTATPAVAGADGCLTNQTAVNLLGVFDEVSARFYANLSDIHPAGMRMENNVILTDGFEATVTELIPENGNSLLQAIWGAYNYLTLTFQAAPAATPLVPGRLLTLVGVRESFGFSVREGRNTANLTIRACGVYPVWA